MLRLSGVFGGGCPGTRPTGTEYSLVGGELTLAVPDRLNARFH